MANVGEEVEAQVADVPAPRSRDQSESMSKTAEGVDNSTAGRKKASAPAKRSASTRATKGRNTEETKPGEKGAAAS